MYGIHDGVPYGTTSSDQYDRLAVDVALIENGYLISWLVPGSEGIFFTADPVGSMGDLIVELRRYLRDRKPQPGEGSDEFIARVRGERVRVTAFLPRVCHGCNPEEK